MSNKCNSISASDEQQGHPRRYWIAFAVTLASLVEGLDTSVVNVSLPQMMSTFGVGLDSIAAVSTGYIVANVIIIPMTGWLASLFGRKRYFMGSLALFTFASFMCGAAGDIYSMIFWRVMQGIGGGALLATSQAILYEVFPPREHARAMAIWGLGIMVGPAMGPPIGGYLTDLLSWPWIFYINIPLGAIGLFLVWVFVPQSKYRDKVTRVDFGGLALLAIGIGSLQILLEKGQSLGWYASPGVLILTMLVVVCMSTFIWWELIYKQPVVDLRILRNTQFTACCLFTFFQAMCTLAIVFVTPLMLIDLMGYSAMETGLIMLPVAVGTGFTMFCVGRVAHRFNPHLIICTGITIFLYAMWRYSYFAPETPKSDFFLPLLLRGIGLGMVFVPINALAVATLPESKFAAATGLLNLTRQLGSSVGIAVAATFLGTIQSHFENLLSASSVTNTQMNSFINQHLVSMLEQRGISHHLAPFEAANLLQNMTLNAAKALAYDRIFSIFGLLLLIVVPLLFFMRHKPESSKEASPGGH